MVCSGEQVAGIDVDTLLKIEVTTSFRAKIEVDGNKFTGQGAKLVEKAEADEKEEVVEKSAAIDDEV